MTGPSYGLFEEGSKRDKEKGVESQILFPNFFVAVAIPKDLFPLLEERSQL